MFGGDGLWQLRGVFISTPVTSAWSHTHTFLSVEYFKYLQCMLLIISVSFSQTNLLLEASSPLIRSSQIHTVAYSLQWKSKIVMHHWLLLEDELIGGGRSKVTMTSDKTVLYFLFKTIL